MRPHGHHAEHTGAPALTAMIHASVHTCAAEDGTTKESSEKLVHVHYGRKPKKKAAAATAAVGGRSTPAPPCVKPEPPSKRQKSEKNA